MMAKHATFCEARTLRSAMSTAPLSVQLCITCAQGGCTCVLYNALVHICCARCFPLTLCKILGVLFLTLFLSTTIRRKSLVPFEMDIYTCTDSGRFQIPLKDNLIGEGYPI